MVSWSCEGGTGERGAESDERRTTRTQFLSLAVALVMASVAVAAVTPLDTHAGVLY